MLASSLAVALWLGPTAQPVEVEWTGPPECPETVLRAALGRHAGALDAAAPVLRIRVAVGAAEGRWWIDLEVEGGGTRRLTADRCEVVVDAAAFVVAQAMSGAVPPPPPVAEVEDVAAPEIAGGGAPDGQATPGVLPAEEPVEVGSIADPGVAVERGSRAPRWRPGGFVRLRGGVSGGALPGATGAFGLAAGLTGRRWRVELTSVGRLPVRKASAEPEYAGRLAMWAVGARGCGVPGVGRFAFPLCAGAEVGLVVGRSVGLTPEGRAANVWAAASAGAGVAWAPIPRLALTLEAELAVALVRHDWVILGLPTLHSLGAADVRGFAGLEVRLGRAKNP